MAIGKNKKISKGKKGGKKKVGDPFLKKEWYDLKAPVMFNTRNFGKTLVTKTIGTKLSEDGLKGRVYEMNLADLHGDEDQGHRKIKLLCEEVQGKNCLTNFAGMDMTRHFLCSLIRKWHSLIEAHVDVKTADGYMLRVFSIGFTQRRKNQIKSTCYLRTSKAKIIRSKMTEVLRREIEKSTLREFVQLIPLNIIERAMDAATRNIFPLQNIFVRKVKVLKRPKTDINRILELHETPVSNDISAPIVDENEAAKNLLSADVEGH